MHYTTLGDSLAADLLRDPDSRSSPVCSGTTLHYSERGGSWPSPDRHGTQRPKFFSLVVHPASVAYLLLGRGGNGELSGGSCEYDHWICRHVKFVQNHVCGPLVKIPPTAGLA